MVSTADDGTITIEPRSLMASYSMFMARRCSATGLSWYTGAACANLSAISVSAVAENDARLPFPFRLRLARHGVFERLRNVHVADLDRLHGDAPGIGLLVQNPLQFLAQHLALGDHLRQLMPADRFAQRGLRAQPDGFDEILHLENDFSAFQTIQKKMASTFTGTVSRVSVDSAVTLATRMR